MREIFKSIIAGMCIGIAGTVYLKVGGLAGAVLFAFGLIAVVSLQLWLFTGMAYKVWRKYHLQLCVILLLNLLGCLAVASIVSDAEITFATETIISQRISQGFLQSGLKAIGCGFIMTTAVTQVKKRNNWLPLIFGVPVFIICGFPHCVADAFYLECCSSTFILTNISQILSFYGAIVIGNYLGCNIFRLTTQPKSNIEAITK